MARSKGAVQGYTGSKEEGGQLNTLLVCGPVKVARSSAMGRKAHSLKEGKRKRRNKTAIELPVIKNRAAHAEESPPGETA